MILSPGDRVICAYAYHGIPNGPPDWGVATVVRVHPGLGDNPRVTVLYFDLGLPPYTWEHRQSSLMRVNIVPFRSNQDA